MKFNISQSRENGKFSFNLIDDSGQIVLNSVNFDDRDSCVAAVRSVTQALFSSDAFETVSEGGKNYYALNNATGQRLGLSQPFDSVAEAQSAVDAIVEDASDETKYEVVLTTSATSEVTTTEVLPSLTDIDFASYYDFGHRSASGATGFEPFIRADSTHTFHYNDAAGSALLYSRSFDSAGRRDKRIRQVIKASEKPERFEVREENGQYYFVIKERNNLEITRSRSFNNRADAEGGVAYCMANIPNWAAQYPEPEAKKRKAVNGYDTSLRSADAIVGFHSVRGDDKQHYFLLNNNAGKPVLFGQGYSSGASRDNGIKVVIKNAGDASRYEIKEENGEYYFVLRSSNRQEVGRSASFTTREEAEKNIAWLVGAVPAYADQYGVDTTTTTQTITNTETESFTIDVDRPVVEEVVIVETPSEAEHDNYLDCGSYKGHNDSPEDAKDFKIFKSDTDGQHYFSMLDNKGEVLFRSEGYPDTASRNNGIKSVQTNREIRERYSIIEENGAHFVILKAGNHREIARSCPYSDRNALLAAYPFMAEGYTGGFPWNVPAKTEAEHDNYLPCRAYRDHNDSPEDAKDFKIFKNDTDGQHYFSMLNNKGEVIFRSEGYPDTASRNNGIKSVQNNREIRERYSIIQEENGDHVVILKAGNHKEIARSCPYKDRNALMALFPFLRDGYVGGFPWGAAAGALGLAGAAAAAPVVAEVVAAPVVAAGGGGASGAIAAAGVAGAAALVGGDVSGAVADEGAAAGSGCMRWLPWLLGALLLAGLLWWLMKGCDNKTTTPAPIVADTTVVVAPPVDTVKIDTVVAAAPAVATASCNCSGNAESIFNIPNKVAKKLPRLGTNPEFGDSHGLSPADFYEKLSKRYKASGVDKRFLDRIYKAMGYTNGFADAKAEQFSELTFPQETAGNLGYSKKHKTGYYTLPDAERDRMAFKIKSNGGCDMYFMRTCGNHFFPNTDCAK